MSNDVPPALKAAKDKMLRSFLKLALYILSVVLIIVGAIWLWLFSFPRPTVLYEKWIGSPVPEDVTNLEGSYSPWSIDPNGALSFEAPETRIETIVKEKGMFEVIPSSPWHKGSPRSVTIDGDESSSGVVYFHRAFSGQDDPSLPKDLRVFWIGMDGSSIPPNGWILYYRPSSKTARWETCVF